MRTERRATAPPNGGGGRRIALTFALLGALLVVLLAANLCMGSQPVSAGELLAILGGADQTSTAAQVIWSIRLPRLLEAALLGGALALSGLLLQTFFNNPIAGPYVLGISHGAKLAVAITMVVVVGVQGVVTSWMSVVSASLGSLAVMGLVLLASRRIGSPGMLVVAGVMIGYLCSAVTDFVVTFASDASIVNLRNWSMGSFSGAKWRDVGVIAVVVLAASACVFMLSKPLGAYLLGERYAQSAGVNIPVFRVELILLSSVLAACVTAFAGPISFVGVAVPHIARRLARTNKPLVVVPASWLGGAVFCLLSDLIARTLFAPTEMSVSTVTAILGAPVVIWVLVRNRQQRASAVARKKKNPSGRLSGDNQKGAAFLRSHSTTGGQSPSGRPPEGFGQNADGPAPKEEPSLPRGKGRLRAQTVLVPAELRAEPTPAPTSGSALLWGQANGGTDPSLACTLQATNLAVGYDGTPLLSNVNIEVGTGRIVTLIGPNGAGKSTILRTLAGELDVLGGTVLFGNKDLKGLSPLEQALERSVLLTERLRTELLTCADVVEMGRYPHMGTLGIPSETDRAAIRDAMELVGVWDLRDRDFAHISDGQRQRVLLARAVCQGPRFLMLDEPSSYLDIRYQIELAHILRHLANTRGIGVVMSLHDLSLARQVSDWLVCIKGDGILAQGTPAKICQSQVVNELYDLQPGSFDPLTGTMVVPSGVGDGDDAHAQAQ